jgi:hypothetical protein
MKLPTPIRGVLEAGRFLYLATPTDDGPHVAPVVFVQWGGRLWVTTSRSSLKARLWRRDGRLGGLIRSGGLAVSFSGRATSYDLLDPGSWGASLRRSPTLTMAAAKFTAKNARFFAGYAVDARHVPLAWTPPGRVFAGIDLHDVALLDVEAGEPLGTWTDLHHDDGREAHDDEQHDEAWEAGMALADADVPSADSYRKTAGRWDPFDAIPPEVSERLGHTGEAVLAVGPRPVPAVWGRGEHGLVAGAPAGWAAWSLDGADAAEAPATLVVDHRSAWRAREMTGVMVRGTGTLHGPDSLASGSRSAATVLMDLGADPDRSTLVRLDPHRAVWWRGWTTATVRPS